LKTKDSAARTTARSNVTPDPDPGASTGTFPDVSHRFLPPFMASLGRLLARFGVFEAPFGVVVASFGALWAPSATLQIPKNPLFSSKTAIFAKI